MDKQITELVEAIVLPIKHKDRFVNLGIKPPKGVLLYGPPGTGKTLLARACAAQTNATFLKLAGPQLVQMFIGDGAKLVRDAFALAKEKSPCIIFIDEIDAIGTKRFDSELSGDREVQRTMLELLNQLDGFSSDDTVKVIAATNRADILDPALMRSGPFPAYFLMLVHRDAVSTDDYLYTLLLLLSKVFVHKSVTQSQPQLCPEICVAGFVFSNDPVGNVFR